MGDLTLEVGIFRWEWTAGTSVAELWAEDRQVPVLEVRTSWADLSVPPTQLMNADDGIVGFAMIPLETGAWAELLIHDTYPEMSAKATFDGGIPLALSKSKFVAPDDCLGHYEAGCFHSGHTVQIIDMGDIVRTLAEWSALPVVGLDEANRRIDQAEKDWQLRADALTKETP